MLWTDRIVAEIREAFAAKIASGEPLQVRDEKTLSGKPHIGSLRSGSMHAFIVDALHEAGIATEYRYEINDTDAFDAVPSYIPAEFAQYLGRRLCDVPSPSGRFANFAEEMADGYCRVMLEAGFPVSFYRQSDNYNSGKFDAAIRTALGKKDLIRAIYKEVSGSQKDESWFPLQVICESCGKIATTAVTGWDGEMADYSCRGCGYAEGCGHSGRISPFGGRATLPWKVEWAAKWGVNGTDIEGAGKDHYAAGGSRMVADRISEEVFGRPHPFGIRHEFILIGGAKMSSSKGVGATAEEVSAMLPRHIFRFMLLAREPMKAINFTPDGDTIPQLFDLYDAAAREYFTPPEERKLPDSARVYELVWHGQSLPERIELLKFSQLVFLLQMPHLDLVSQVEEIITRPLTAAEKSELAIRLDYGRRWLAEIAPDSYRFQIGDYSDSVQPDESELAAIRLVLAFLQANPAATGHDIHTRLHEIKSEIGIEPKKLFTVFYRALLGRDNGPQLGFMLGALPREQVLTILSKMAS